MIFDKLFRTQDILGTALKASEYKNQVLLNNIANNDTPGFKAQDVEFESVMRDALDSYEITGRIEPDNIMTQLYTRHTNYKTRIDKNNVDIESEMVEFYKNAAKYDMITNCILNDKNMINNVISGSK